VVKYRLEFSVGPVQGFIGQARRTRDLWAGSYLLSYLSAVALHGAVQQGVPEENVDPKALCQDDMYQWVASGKREAPETGSFPNHFTLFCDSEQEAQKFAEAAQEAFQDEWRRIAGTVWQKYLAQAEHLGEGTRSIWNRQVEGFWEILWIAGPAGEKNLLDTRKRWRTHWLPEEPGDKCSVMPQLQELSGWVRAHHREKQDEFWEKVRDALGELNLRRNERLSAIALIKRALLTAGKEIFGQEWGLPGWPSVVYIAAVPWIRQVLENSESRTTAAQFARELREAAGDKDAFEYVHGKFRGINFDAANGFAKIDPAYLHRVTLRNRNVTPFQSSLSEDEEKRHREKLLELLKNLSETKVARAGARERPAAAEPQPEGQASERDKEELGEPASYYAVILADGDRMGKLLSELSDMGKQLSEFSDKKSKISEGLLEFARGAREPQLLEATDARVVYAGGDDVLAFAPVETALDYARTLPGKFTASLEQTAGADVASKASLSAAVVFTHIHAPLTRVLEEARKVLETFAKDKNGRNSLAISVYGAGGRKLLWRSTWKRDSANGDVVDLLCELRDELRKPANRELSTTLLHNLFDLLARLGCPEGWKPGTVARFVSGLEVEKLLASESWRSLSRRSVDGEADKRSQEVARKLRAVIEEWRNADGKPEPSGCYLLDGLLLVQFLAGGGREEEHA